MTTARRVWRSAWLCGLLSVCALAACGGGSTAVASAPATSAAAISADPEVLQAKMQIVQQQFQAEQQVLAQNKDSLLNIVAGGGAEAPANLFDVLRDPTILLRDIGDAAESGSINDLVAGWQAHAGAWCTLGPNHFDDAFFRAYGGAHVLPALVAFLDTYCGKADAAALVRAADARGLGEGMAASKDPTAGIDLDQLLTRLNG
jgi:hypothetical protein